MWEKLTLWFRFLWDAGENLQEYGAAIEELRENDKRVLEMLRMLIAENEMLEQQLRHEREKRADELEKIELRLRLQISEELRRLPPPK